MKKHLDLLLRKLPEQSWHLTVALPPSVDLPGIVRRFDLEITDRPDIARDLKSAVALRRIIRRSGTLIVHSHGIRAAWIASLAGLRPGVATLHNLLAPRGISRWPASFALRSQRRIICVSEAVKRSAVAAGADGARITVIPNGIEWRDTPVADRTDLLTTLELPPDAHAVVCVARLMPDKGVDLLLEAWKTLQDDLPHHWLLIAGDGPDYDQLARQAADLNRVRMLGHVNDAACLYDVAEIVVIPSRREGQSIVCLEAMASPARPVVVASDSGGLAEMATEGETGFVFPAGNAVLLASAVRRAAGDAGAARQIASRAFEMVRSRYSASAMAAATAGLYEAVFSSLQRKERPGGSPGRS